MAHHRSHMTIYFKRRGSWVLTVYARASRSGSFFTALVDTSKSKNVRLYLWSGLKFAASRVNCSECILTYAGYYNDTTPKLRDHIFKKSERPWLASFAKLQPKYEKVRLYICGKTKFFASRVNYTDYIFSYSWHYNRTTETPGPFI